MLILQGNTQAGREKRTYITCKIITTGAKIHSTEPYVSCKKSTNRPLSCITDFKSYFHFIAATGDTLRTLATPKQIGLLDLFSAFLLQQLHLKLCTILCSLPRPAKLVIKQELLELQWLPSVMTPQLRKGCSVSHTPACSLHKCDENIIMLHDQTGSKVKKAVCGIFTMLLHCPTQETNRWSFN